MADLQANDIIISILNGDQDESIVEIGKALDQRLKAGAAREVWWVYFDGEYISANSWSAAEARFFEIATSVRYDKANPEIMLQRGAIVVAHLVEAKGTPVDAAWKRLRDVTADELTYGSTTQVNPPKDDSSSAA